MRSGGSPEGVPAGHMFRRWHTAQGVERKRDFSRRCRFGISEIRNSTSSQQLAAMAPKFSALVRIYEWPSRTETPHRRFGCTLHFSSACISHVETGPTLSVPSPIPKSAAQALAQGSRFRARGARGIPLPRAAWRRCCAGPRQLLCALLRATSGAAHIGAAGRRGRVLAVGLLPVCRAGVDEDLRTPFRIEYDTRFKVVTSHEVK